MRNWGWVPIDDPSNKGFKDGQAINERSSQI